MDRLDGCRQGGEFASANEMDRIDDKSRENVTSDLPNEVRGPLPIKGATYPQPKLEERFAIAVDQMDGAKTLADAMAIWGTYADLQQTNGFIVAKERAKKRIAAAEVTDFV
jgi:hypothetical protein